MTACDSSDDDPVIDGDLELEGEQSELEELDGDVETETEAEDESDPMALLPNEPDAADPARVMTDEPYLQEFNHTTNEVPEGMGALVALVEPPQSLTGFNHPSYIASRGIWRQNEQESWEMVTIPEASSGLIAAETALDTLFLASADTLYKVEMDATLSVVAEVTPGVQITKLVFADDELILLTTNGWARYNGTDAPQWQALENVPTTLLKKDDTLYLAWENVLAAYPIDDLPQVSNENWRVALEIGVPVAILADRTLPEALDLVVVGSDGLAAFNVESDQATKVQPDLFETGYIPLNGAVTGVEDSNGGFLVAADGGAYRIIDDDLGPEFRVYVPERWMPSGDVRDVLVQGEGVGGKLFFATSAGPGWVDRKMWTIKDKTDAMIERIVLRHNREGALADSRLTVPGDLSTSIPYDSDNDGGWTCYWVLSECFRYKLTGDAEAKAHFDESLARMLSFRTLTGTDYFLARSVIRIDGCQLDDCDGPDDGEWFKSPDGEWWVKANTSNDEVTSHMFMMGQAYDYCADDEQKEAIAAHVDGIIGGIVENGYMLFDPQDGKCTKYGQFDPFYVNDWFDGSVGDGGRRSAQMLGALNLAYYLTGKQKYLDAKEELMSEYHYDLNISNIADAEIYPFCAGSGDCDELAMQAFWPLLRYEWDPALREQWMIGWNRLYSQLVTQEDIFWDITNAAFGGEMDYDFTNGKRWYRRYPTDLVRWNIRNQGKRLDVGSVPAYYMVKEENPNYFKRADDHIFPGDERPNIRHNGPQFQFSGGWGSLRELDGGDALWPYWLGRYYGFIAEPEAR